MPILLQPLLSTHYLLTNCLLLVIFIFTLNFLVNFSHKAADATLDFNRLLNLVYFYPKFGWWLVDMILPFFLFFLFVSTLFFKLAVDFDS